MHGDFVKKVASTGRALLKGISMARLIFRKRLCLLIAYNVCVLRVGNETNRDNSTVFCTRHSGSCDHDLFGKQRQWPMHTWFFLLYDTSFSAWSTRSFEHLCLLKSGRICLSDLVIVISLNLFRKLTYIPGQRWTRTHWDWSRWRTFYCSMKTMCVPVWRRLLNYCLVLAFCFHSLFSLPRSGLDILL